MEKVPARGESQPGVKVPARLTSAKKLVQLGLKSELGHAKSTCFR